MSDAPNNPLPGAIGITVLLTFAVMSVITIIVSISEYSQISIPARLLTIQIFCLFLFVGWFCYGVSESSDQYASRLVLYSVFFGIFVGMISFPFPMLFWIGLIAYVAWGLYIRYQIDEQETTDLNFEWSTVSPYISIAWITSGIFIALGFISLPYFPQYSTPLLEVTEKQAFIDWRLLVTSVFATIFLIRSIVITQRPRIRGFQPIRFPRLTMKAFFVPILNAIIVTLNAIIYVAAKVVNVIWKVVATMAVWLAKVARTMIVEFIESIKKMRFVDTVLKEVVTFSVVVTLATVIRELAEPTRSFLASTGEIGFSLDEKNMTLLMLVVVFVMSLLSILFLGWLWKLSDDVLDRAATAGADTAVIFAFVSVLIWVISSMNLFRLPLYRPGLYTSAVGVVMVVVFLVLIAKWLVNVLFGESASDP
jgi:hypothetical protein